MQVPPMSGTRPDDLWMSIHGDSPCFSGLGCSYASGFQPYIPEESLNPKGVTTRYQLSAPGSRAQLGKFDLFGYLVSMFQIICLAL